MVEITELELDELELDKLEDKRELLELDSTITLDDELESTTDDWLDLDELGTELWLDGVTDAR